MIAKQIPDCVKDRLIYEKDTGLFVWKFKNKMHPHLFMKQAGFVRDGYVVIKINGSAFRAHRLAWFLSYNDQPHTIDHINGDKQDNRLSNLRNVSASENAKNHGKSRNNSGLPCGVREMPYGKYQSRITCNKKVFYLGIFDSICDAETAYLIKRKELFGEYCR